MSSEKQQLTFEECSTEDDAREVIAQRYNNIVVEAMEADFDPLFTARELRDHSGATVVALHSTSVREQMDSEDDNSGGGNHGGVLDGGSHPLR